MALLSAYTDIAYADEVNLDNVTWEDADDDQKDNALVMARYYIDSKYKCNPPTDMDDSDLTTVPDEYQTANALLAVPYLDGTLYATDPLGGQAIVSESVKAGSVSTSTEYSGIGGQTVKKGDPYPQVTALLSPYCSLGSSGLLVRV